MRLWWGKPKSGNKTNAKTHNSRNFPTSLKLNDLKLHIKWLECLLKNMDPEWAVSKELAKLLAFKEKEKNEKNFGTSLK